MLPNLSPDYIVFLVTFKASSQDTLNIKQRFISIQSSKTEIKPESQR